MSKRKNRKSDKVEKLIVFGKQLFAGVLRSRTGALTQIATLLRFSPCTKTFERQYNKLLPLINQLKETFQKTVLSLLPTEGFRLGIIDDTDIKKTGKSFPKQQKHHDHSNNCFFDGMKVVSSVVYQNGKMATVSSKIVGKDDNKLDVAKEDIDYLINFFNVDIFLFDAWYCKSLVLEKIASSKKVFISRLRRDTKALLDEDEERLDALSKSLVHKNYRKIKIAKKSYWICELDLKLKAYGDVRIVISKDAYNADPIFFITNSVNFDARFIVKLYMRRFNIETFFKDAKQFLNFETFFCRTNEKWEMHLLLTNVLHWSIQRRKSISKTVHKVRENIEECNLLINENPLLDKFFEDFKNRCLT